MTKLMRVNRGGDAIEAMRRDMESLLGYAPRFSGEGRIATAWFPIDLVETADGYKVVAEVPGVPKEDIEISLEDNVLTLKVSKRMAELAEGDSVHVRERVFGDFTRSISLPRDIDADRVTAGRDNGIVTVSIPKAESSKPRQIQISAD